MSSGPIGAVSALKIVFHGIDNVTRVSESVLSKIRGLGGIIAAMGGVGLFATTMGEHFGLVDKNVAVTLDRQFALIAAMGTLVNVFGKIIPLLNVSSSLHSVIGAAHALSLALSDSAKWSLLAAGIVSVVAAGLLFTSMSQLGGSGASTSQAPGGQDRLDAAIMNPSRLYQLSRHLARSPLQLAEQLHNVPADQARAAAFWQYKAIETVEINIDGSNKTPDQVASEVVAEIKKLQDRLRTGGEAAFTS